MPSELRMLMASSAKQTGHKILFPIQNEPLLLAMADVERWTGRTAVLAPEWQVLFHPLFQLSVPYSFKLGESVH